MYRLDTPWERHRYEGFEFPDGERQADFRARVLRGLQRVQRSGAESVILVAHKGVVRGVVEALSGVTLPPLEPELGGVTQVIRRADGNWAATALP